MIQHFNNLQTPLRCIHKYPQLTDQQRRFREAGWSSATTRSLWEIWADHSIVTPQQKTKLDAVEPFDEWEEFVLFASHYFILVAAKPPPGSSFLLHCLETQQQANSSVIPLQTAKLPLNVHCDSVLKTGSRRFGALLPVSPNVLGHHGGLGPQTRLGNLDYYGPAGCQVSNGISAAKTRPRMCHTITHVSQSTSLLVGGRVSPAKALKDCWILCERSYRVDDLPLSLYRHCATKVDFQQGGRNLSGILIYGGKSGESQVSNRWLLWRESGGWIQLGGAANDLQPRFGAALASVGFGTGLLIGGMDAYGSIFSEVREWSIVDGAAGLSIILREVYTSWTEVPGLVRGQENTIPSPRGSSPTLNGSTFGRMGACLVNSPSGLLLIGGVSGPSMTRDSNIIALAKAKENKDGRSSWSYALLSLPDQVSGQRPLFVGHTALLFHGSVVIIGGGAVCFSFGTYWNQCVATLTATGREQLYLRQLSVDPAQRSTLASMKKEGNLAEPLPLAGTTPTPKVKEAEVISAEDFKHIVDRGNPVVIRQCQLGSCTTAWTVDNVKAKIGVHRAVSFHMLGLYY